MARPGLKEHPKFKRLVDLLDIPEAHVRGHLEYLWETGYATGDPYIGDERDVELAAGYKPKDGKLCKALLAVRLIDQLDDGKYQIHDLLENAPDFVKARGRMRHYRRRSRTGEVSTYHTPTELRNGSVTQPLRNSSEQLLFSQNRTESNTPLPPKGETTAKTKEVEIPPTLDTEAFRSAWADWLQHRREKRKNPTPTALRKQLSKLAGWGPERAVAAIQHSITQDWQGIFEPKGDGAASAPLAVPPETDDERAERIFRQREARKAKPTDPEQLRQFVERMKGNKGEANG